MPEYYILLFAAGFHHDYGDVFYLLYDVDKRRLSQELLAQWECAGYPDVKAALGEFYCIVHPEISQKMILVKGLLHTCDYAACGNTDIEYKYNFLVHTTLRFFDKKGFSYNEMQKFCLERLDENIMALGPTGVANTEAGLLCIGDFFRFIFLPVLDGNQHRVRSNHNLHYSMTRNRSVIDKQLGLLHSDAPI